jgi:pyruvate/2-oxoglutarate dehydrogenase complex dihydrolipoamide dehydrogenase (E3) component
LLYINPQAPQLTQLPTNPSLSILESFSKMSSLDAASLFGVKGLVAVITGGGTGIGLMMAKALEHNGAKVYIIGRRLETLQTAAKEAVRLVPLLLYYREKLRLFSDRNTVTSSLFKAT